MPYKGSTAAKEYLAPQSKAGCDALAAEVKKLTDKIHILVK